MIDCIYLEEAKYLDGFRIFLKFNDGKSGVVDLKETVFRHPIATPLRELKVFSKFYLDSWPTLAWDCGFDVAPETLYEKCEASIYLHENQLPRNKLRGMNSSWFVTLSKQALGNSTRRD